MIIDPSRNSIVCGDNIEWLTWLPDNSVDLCYIDPPFFSNRHYEVIWGNGYEVRSFGDRFAGGIGHYIEWMRPRIELIRMKLKNTGSIFLHCDWHASHRLRVLLDEIFGEQNFINEIVWKRKLGTGPVFKRFSNNHDTIFFYSKSSKYLYQKQFTETSTEDLARKYNLVDENGRRFHSGPTDNPAYRPNLIYTFKGYKPPKNGWRWTKEKMEQFEKEGRLLFPKSKDARIRLKLFMDEAKGDPVSDTWDDISAIQSQSNERLGYPTQKPEELIERILLSASKEGDLILDCYAGGGTTAKVAHDLNRRFIVGDVSPVAVKIIAQRLNIDCVNAGYDVLNLPQTVEEFQKINGHKFAELICDLMGWRVSDRKSNDGGVDGTDGDGNPIQIKNHSNSSAGRPEIQKFHSAIIKAKRKKGIFVAWQFGRPALEYIAEMKREHGIEIVAKNCSEIFGDLVIAHDKAENIEKLYAERFPEIWKGKIERVRTIDPSEIVSNAVDQLASESQQREVLQKIKAARDKISGLKGKKRKKKTN